MRKIKRFLSALLCGAILITGTLAGVSVRTDAAASSYAVQLRAAGFPDSYISALSALIFFSSTAKSRSFSAAI